VAPFLKRLLLTLVALPTVYVLSNVLTGYTHLAMAIVVSLVMAGGAAETGALLGRAGLPRSRFAIPVLAGTLPAVTYCEMAAILPQPATLVWVTLLGSGILVEAVAAGERVSLREGLPRVSVRILQLVYPALLGSFIVRIAGLREPGADYVLFFALVFGNDMAAYVAGRLLGRTTLHLKVSPGKTGAGYAGGLVVSVAVSLLLRFFFPEVFPYPPVVMGLLGGVTALATFAGDLAESALKRSADVKDSGLIMLGRGGILDSVDSVVMSAPVFYLFLGYLGGS
jgi:phosphatidate cytidylyltransferase